MKKILLTALICLWGGVAFAASYIDNGNGTVTDQSTGLIWQQASAATVSDWQTSLAYCNALTLGGASDWRLPNVKELFSLIDTSTTALIDPVFSSSASGYWSSTTALAYSTPDYAYFVSFDFGDVVNVSKTAKFLARCVR